MLPGNITIKIFITYLKDTIMDQQNNLYPRGVFRNERKLLSDYRQRGYWIGALQLSGSIGYLLAALLFQKLMLMSSSAFNRKYTNFTEYENGTSSASESPIVQNSALETAFSKLYIWMTLNVIKAILHIVSSIFVIWASWETTPKLRAIRLCNLAKRMNFAFLLDEIVVCVFMYQNWQVALYFIIYRLWFNHEITGLLNTVQILSPPPPGHYC